MTGIGRSSKVAGVKTVLLLLLVCKFVGLGLTVFTDLNVFAQSDVTRFAANAEFMAGELIAGRFPAGRLLDITYTWPLALSVFWIVPGPNWLYARIFLSGIGAVAIYNVYLIGRYYHSPEAGLLASLPMIAYPSFVLVHASILREAVVLFGLTTAMRLLFVGGAQRHQSRRVAGAAVLLGIVTILRAPNLFIYVAMLATAALATGTTISVDRSGMVLATVLGGISSVVFLASRFEGPGQVVSYVSSQRAARAHGDAVYLADIVPGTVFEMVAFSWIGAGYFLFVPFPWMISSPAWMIASLEGLGNFVYVLFSLQGFRYLFHRAKPMALTLSVGAVLAVLMYGLIEGNVGPAVRHRQQFVWIVYLFGAIGMFESIKIVNGER